ncbi:MAG: hypothetical protein MJK12_04250 [Colwellia sp.]|nr:hypothetical protein [Colwellia sp.]
MKYISHVFILLSALLISACSSVPLSTIVHFYDAKPEDFFQVDPRGITVKVTINSAANFDPLVSVNLSATIESDSVQRVFIFPLERLSLDKLPAEDGYFSSRPPMDVFILKLSEQAIKNLELINFERKSAKKQRGGLSAGVNFSKGVNIVDENTVLSIGLKLDETSDFIMLIDNWHVQDVQ